MLLSACGERSFEYVVLFDWLVFADSSEDEAAADFVVNLADLRKRANIWLDDYGVEHFVQQGPWIDPSRLTRPLP